MEGPSTLYATFPKKRGILQHRHGLPIVAGENPCLLGGIRLTWNSTSVPDRVRHLGSEAYFVLSDLAKVPVGLGLEILLGSVLLVSATSLGWVVGRRRSWAPVRVLSWWMHAVVLPLLTSRSWSQRSLIIFANNSVVLAALVVAGAWRLTGAAAVSVVGLALGIALRSLSELSPYWSSPSPNCAPEIRRRVRLGVGLNLLEPPAIAVAVGLCIGRSTAPLEPMHIWATFLLWVVPLLFIAACGESLWLGVGLRSEVTTEPVPVASQGNLDRASRLA